MKSLLSAICCLFVVLNGHSQIDPVLAQQFQDILDYQVTVGGSHGVSACVIMPDGTMWLGQSGANAIAENITEATVFHGASATKTHTAACMMLLAEDGLVDLDAPWTDYVTLDVSFDPTITVRQLLSNTSGIADYLEISGSGNYVLNDPSHFFTPQEILEDIVSDTPDFAPGTDFHYSTSNFVLAGLIIEAVCGHPLFEEMRTRIWEPLGLEHTYGGAYDTYSESRAGVWWDFGNGFNSYNLIPETSMLSYGYGGSGIVSTPHDMAVFIRALLTGQLVNASSLEQMHVFSPQSYDDWSVGYGLGMHHAINVGDDQVIGVDGYYTNMSSSFHSETDGFTIATMTNTQTAWYGIFSPLYNAMKDYLATHITEQDPNPSLLLYPNPAAHELFLPIRNFSVLHYRVFNADGSEVMQGNSSTSQKVEIDVSHLNSGIYHLVLETDTGTRFGTFVVN